AVRDRPVAPGTEAVRNERLGVSVAGGEEEEEGKEDSEEVHYCFDESLAKNGSCQVCTDANTGKDHSDEEIGVWTRRFVKK
ncbi:hypothetical protein OFC04_26290, partial [Escherichia coli]|nr:hypothetical protein [Escherichia coli]